jgi:hypothetical protein
MTETCARHWLVKVSELYVYIINGLITFLLMQEYVFILGNLLEMQDPLTADPLIRPIVRKGCSVSDVDS